MDMQGIDSIKNHLYIVFGYEHYNPLGIVRSLGESGILSIGVIIRSKKPIVSKSIYLKELYLVDSIDEGYALIIQRYGSENTKSFILASDDTICSYLDSRLDELNNFIVYNGGTKGRITTYMNKELLLRSARECGFKTPREFVFDGNEIPNDISYPVITKANDSLEFGWKKHEKICFSKTELQEMIDNKGNSKLIVQSYINKKNELCLDGVSINDGKDVFVAIASTYTYIIEDSYSFAFDVKNFESDELQRKLTSLLSQIGFNGIFSAEFIVEDDGSLVFLEINFRHSTWGYAATCLGMNLVTIWAYGMLNGRYPGGIKKVIPDNYTAMVELPDFRYRVLGRRISIFKWLAELRTTNCIFYYNKADPKPFWSAVFHSVVK